MTFRELIEGIHAKDPMIQGGALAGSDGLAVDSWRAPSSTHDLPALCAEMVRFLKESGRITKENGLGESSEVFLAADRGHVYLRRVTEEYFLLLVASGDAVPGRCRFLLRQGSRHARELL